MRRARSRSVGLWALLAINAHAASPVLTTITDVPLPGNATRFDYQSFDPKTKTLYLSHMGDGELGRLQHADPNRGRLAFRAFRP